MQGKLYVVATPIGNLADISYRAVEVLNSVDLIAAEDTRHSGHLFSHYNISTRCVALHQHNEQKVTGQLIGLIQGGQSIALISDAGTPLVRDPGYVLVSAAIDQQIEVIPVPGCSALLTALSASGLPADHFTFVGFPPRSSSARQTFFGEYAEQQGTLIFYESSHRIVDCIGDLGQVFPGNRNLVIARELTKHFETFIRTTIAEGIERLKADPNQQKGEFVVLVQGVTKTEKASEALSSEQRRVLTVLLKSLPVKTAVQLGVELTGARKKLLYKEALLLNGGIEVADG